MSSDPRITHFRGLPSQSSLRCSNGVFLHNSPAHISVAVHEFIKIDALPSMTAVDALLEADDLQDVQIAISDKSRIRSHAIELVQENETQRNGLQAISEARISPREMQDMR